MKAHPVSISIPTQNRTQTETANLTIDQSIMDPSKSFTSHDNSFLLPISDQNASRVKVTASSDDDTAFYRNFYHRCGNIVGFISTWVCCLCCRTPYKRIQQGFVGIKMKFGKANGSIMAPGLYFVNPCTEKLILVDKRETVINVPQLHVVSKDNITSIVDVVVYVKIANAYRSVFKVSDAIHAVQILVTTSLRDVIGKITLQDLLEERQTVADTLYSLIAPISAEWGVDVRRTMIQDIRFTNHLSKQLATAATSRRIAEAKVISAQADARVAKLMKNASEILDTESAMQIRYLESIHQISKTANTKVVFFPSEFSSTGLNSLQNMTEGNNLGWDSD